MILTVCVDDRFGMLFNSRRQSRDSAVVEKILELAAGKILWMNSYSRDLFPKDAPIRVAEDFLTIAEGDDYCFAENCDIESLINRAKKIILFRWNRSYPADLHFPKEILCHDWTVELALDFVGNSHDKITMEVYSR